MPLRAFPSNLTVEAELLGSRVVIPVGVVCEVAWAYARKRKFQEAYDLAVKEDCIEGVAFRHTRLEILKALLRELGVVLTPRIRVRA